MRTERTLLGHVVFFYLICWKSFYERNNEHNMNNRPNYSTIVFDTLAIKDRILSLKYKKVQLVLSSSPAGFLKWLWGVDAPRYEFHDRNGMRSERGGQVIYYQSIYLLI